MGEAGCIVSIWVKVITWKIAAVTTKSKAFVLNTLINTARFSHAKKSNRSIFISTPLANCFFKGDPQVLGYCGS